jgi:hypothetical protein
MLINNRKEKHQERDKNFLSFNEEDRVWDGERNPE